VICADGRGDDDDDDDDRECRTVAVSNVPGTPAPTPAPTSIPVGGAPVAPQSTVVCADGRGDDDDDDDDRECRTVPVAGTLSTRITSAAVPQSTRICSPRGAGDDDDDDDDNDDGNNDGDDDDDDDNNCVVVPVCLFCDSFGDYKMKQ